MSAGCTEEHTMSNTTVARLPSPSGFGDLSELAAEFRLNPVTPLFG